MNLGIILAAISILIVAGPLVSAVVIYKDEPIALVLPNVEEVTDNIQNFVPKVEYEGYEIVDPDSSFRVKFNITNNSNKDLTFNTINFSAYCKQHPGVFLGYGQGENFPLTVPEESSRILSILLTYTSAGRTHMENLHKGDTNFHAILKQVHVAVMGVEIELEDEVDIGPIQIPS